MIDPTPEQIKAEALRRFPFLAPSYAPLTYPAGAMRSHNRAAFKGGARWAALVASAGAASQEPRAGSGDREKLLNGLRDALELVVHDGQGYYSREIFVGTDIVREALAALAAPPQVDEAKLAEAIGHALDDWQGEELPEVFVARAIAEWLRGGGR